MNANELQHPYHFQNLLLANPMNAYIFTVINNLLPNGPPGWKSAKCSGFKSRSFINATAKASPITKVAVVEEVGANLMDKLLAQHVHSNEKGVFLS